MRAAALPVPRAHAQPQFPSASARLSTPGSGSWVSPPSIVATAAVPSLSSRQSIPTRCSQVKQELDVTPRHGASTEAASADASQWAPTPAVTLPGDASRRVVSPESCTSSGLQQASSSAVRRLLTPMQSCPSGPIPSAVQVLPAWGSTVAKSISSPSTASWPGGPVRHSPQQSQAAGIEWRVDAPTPRNVHFNEAGGQVSDEVLRQTGSTAPPTVSHVSSMERLGSSALHSREPSPDEHRSCSSDRHAGGLHEPSREASRDAHQGETLSNVVRGLSPRAKQLGAPPPVGKSGRMAMRSSRQDSLGSRMRMSSPRGKKGGREEVPSMPKQSQPRSISPSGRSHASASNVRNSAASSKSTPSFKNEVFCDGEGYSGHRMLSPREDRIGVSPPATRSNSQAELNGNNSKASGSTSRSGAVATEQVDMSTVVQLRRDMDEMRQENARLQEKLAKARSLVLLLQKQAEEARADRDKEHKRAEGLQLSAQQLQRQLRQERARANSLERCAAASRADVGGSPSIAEEEEEIVTETSELIVLGSAAQDSGTPTSARTVADGQLPESIPEASVIVPEATPEASPEGLPSGMERTWEFVVQGKHDDMELQADFAPKLVSCFPDDALERAWSRGVACVCSRGRRLDNSTPNQDDFLVARHTLANNGHIALYGVFDGHGPAGHHCASFVRGSLPESLFGHPALLQKPEETLRRAFELTQAALLQQPFDTENSGTTAALSLVLNVPTPTMSTTSGQASESDNETWLFVAHVGDSRIILASQDEANSFSVTALTRDHRPDDAEEADRIRREGGEVRKLHRNSAAVRIFAVDQDRPASALTRCLGASASSMCGVVPDPEINAYRLRPGVDVLLLLGTDGLFEFCNDRDAVGAMLRSGVDVPALEEICAESRRQWASSSYNETVDDVTAIAVSLPLNGIGFAQGDVR